VARSGSAADTQAISDMVKHYLEMHSTELGEEPLVKTASALVQQICYFNKNDLLAGMIIAGWDKHEGGQVYCIPLGGVRVRQPWAIGGSGSTYIYAYCDSTYRANMNEQESLKWVQNCTHIYQLFHYL